MVTFSQLRANVTPLLLKRPLMALALMHVAGILLAAGLPLAPVPLLGSCALLLLFSLAWPSTQRLCLPLLIVLSGATSLTVQTTPLNPNDLRELLTDRFEEITLRASLGSSPKRTDYQARGLTLSRTTVELQVNQIRRSPLGWQPAWGKVLATIPGDFALPRGRDVEVAGVIAPPEPPAAPGLFNYQTYLQRKGIHFVLKTDSTNDWIAAPPGFASPPPAVRFRSWAQAALARGLPENDPQVKLIWAMTLGWKTALTGEVAEPFMRSGTMHVFAISGLHIAMIAMIVLGLLQVLTLPRRLCGLLLIPALWCYAAVTGWQPSAVRATTMSTVVIAGWALRRPADLLNSLSLAALLLLLADPLQLFQAGFQLSFSVVLSIALFVPALERVRQRLMRRDPLQLPAPQPRWKTWLRTAAHYLASTTMTSFAAWAGSIPLVAVYFNFFTPVALLANLLILPLTALALMSSLGSLFTSPWFPACSVLFNHSAWWWMFLMTKITAWAADLPAAWFHVASPSLTSCLFYYAALIPLTQHRLKTIHKALALALLVVTAILSQYSLRQHPQLFILPLNGGEALYYPGSKGERNCLVDCGNDSSINSITLPFLRTHGVNRLARLILTHGDIRNVGGARQLDETIAVDRFTFSPHHFRSKAYRDLHASLLGSDRFEEVHLGNRAGPWTLLHPKESDRFSHADDGTTVLQATFGKTQVLFLSDLGRRGQAVLMNRHPDLRANILITGLPGASPPLAPELVQAVSPDLIIVTDSLYPAAERAGRDLETALRKTGCPVIYTRLSGGITLTFQDDGWSLFSSKGTTATSP